MGISVWNVSPVDKFKQLIKSQDGYYINITKIFLTDPEFLKYAYNLLMCKSIVPTFSKSCRIILEAQYLGWFQEIAYQLKKGTYSFKPKLLGSKFKQHIKKFRSFVVDDLRDNIVQKSIHLVLEEIYERREKEFSKFSYGFRSGSNCHSALQAIKLGWYAVPWYIKGKISNSFRSVNRDLLFMILKRKINDKRFFDILYKLYKAKFLTLFGFLEDSTISHLNFVSSIFSNIYLNEFDQYVRLNWLDNYKKVSSFILSNIDVVDLVVPKQKKESLQDMYQVYQQKPGFVNKNKSFLSIKYIRYANDFLIGVIGVRAEAYKVQKEVLLYLRSILQLEIKEENMTLINAFSDKVNFLGMSIYNVIRNKRLFNSVNKLEILQRRKIRLRNRIFSFNARREKVLREKLLNNLRVSYFQAQCKGTLEQHEVKLDSVLQSLLGQSIKKSCSLQSTSRDLYRQLVKNLLQISDIKNEQKLKNFLELWEKGLVEEKEKLLGVSSLENIFGLSRKFLSPLSSCSQKRSPSLICREVLQPQIMANLTKIYYKLERVGIINSKRKPIAKVTLLHLQEHRIFQYFNSVAQSLLLYYRCVDNFYVIKSIIQYQIRYSLLYTLMRRKKFVRLSQVIRYLSEDVIEIYGRKKYQFLNLVKISNLKKAFLTIKLIDFDLN